MLKVILSTIAILFLFTEMQPAFAVIDHNSSRSNISRKKGPKCPKGKAYSAKAKKCVGRKRSNKKKKN